MTTPFECVYAFQNAWTSVLSFRIPNGDVYTARLFWDRGEGADVRIVFKGAAYTADLFGILIPPFDSYVAFTRDQAASILVTRLLHELETSS